MLVGVNQEIVKGLKDDPNGDHTGQTFLSLVRSPFTICRRRRCSSSSFLLVVLT
jgi:hypothetical protein